MSGSGREPAPQVAGSLRVEEAVAALAIAAIAAISFGNVVVRYLTDASFAFTEEWSVFLLVLMTFTGAAYAFRTDQHIRIAALEQRLGPSGAAACRTVTILAVTVVLGLVTWHAAELAFEQWRFEETSPGLGYPQWRYTAFLPVLTLVCLLRAWQRFVADLRHQR
jgi:TRAP-type C4-dicarboxylate transport system permease small subunit